VRTHDDDDDGGGDGVAQHGGHTPNNRLTAGGVRATTAMHYFAKFPTWRKIVVMRAFFSVYLLIVFSAFAHHFYTKMLYLASMRVAKSHFGTEILSFRAYQGKLWHFLNKENLSHFCLSLVGRNFWLLAAFSYWCWA